MIALVAAGILGSCGHEDKSIKLNNPRDIRGVVSYKRSFGDLNDPNDSLYKTQEIRIK